MKIFVNAISAKMGGAATYIIAVAREFARAHREHQFTFFLPAERAEQIRAISPSFRVVTSEAAHGNLAGRLWFEQVTLRRDLRTGNADVLFSTANLGMLACPCFQVLLVRNALYFSRLYGERFLPKQPWRARLANWLRARMTAQSAKAADVVMTPSTAMMDELCASVSVPAAERLVNPYGVSDHIVPRAATRIADRPLQLIFPALYAEHKNLGTLLRALARLSEQGHRFEFHTTADPNAPDARHTSTWQADAELARTPGLAGRVHFHRFRGSEDAARMYGEGDVFVYPSVVESFGHPLVEAMAAGLPVLAADVAINREICGEAAVYFSPFDVEECAVRLAELLADPALRQQLGECGRTRARSFTWEKHVATLLARCEVTKRDA